MDINRARRKILLDVSQRLRQLRGELGYTPKEMAGRIGIAAVSYYRNEVGDSLLNPVALKKMQKEFGISMDWLLFGKGPMYYEQKAIEAGQAEKIQALEAAAEKMQALEAAAEKRAPAWEELIPDAEEFLEQMAADPLLRHKVLLFFYEYKNQKNPSLQPTRDPEPAPADQPDPERRQLHA